MRKELIGTFYYNKGFENNYEGVFVPVDHEIKLVQGAYISNWGGNKKKIYQKISDNPEEKMKYAYNVHSLERIINFQTKDPSMHGELALRSVSDGKKDYLMLLSTRSLEDEKYYYRRLGFPEHQNKRMDMISGIYDCKLYSGEMIKGMFE